MPKSPDNHLSFCPLNISVGLILNDEWSFLMTFNFLSFDNCDFNLSYVCEMRDRDTAACGEEDWTGKQLAGLQNLRGQRGLKRRRRETSKTSNHCNHIKESVNQTYCQNKSLGINRTKRDICGTIKGLSNSQDLHDVTAGCVKIHSSLQRHTAAELWALHNNVFMSTERSWCHYGNHHHHHNLFSPDITYNIKMLVSPPG